MVPANAKTERNVALINLWIELGRRLDKITLGQLAAVFSISVTNVRRLILDQKLREFHDSPVSRRRGLR